MQADAAKNQIKVISNLKTSWHDDTIMEMENPEVMLFQGVR